jgi:hypothetical protein
VVGRWTLVDVAKSLEVIFDAPCRFLRDSPTIAVYSGSIRQSDWSRVDLSSSRRSVSCSSRIRVSPVPSTR